jgi:hypothetical protein
MQLNEPLYYFQTITLVSACEGMHLKLTLQLVHSHACLAASTSTTKQGQC